MAVFRRSKVWWYDFRINGVRIRESTNATTRSAAIQAEALRKTELARGHVPRPVNGPTPRFVDFAQGEFANWCANEHRDHASTYERYMRSIKALREFFGSRTLNAIDSGLVEKYKLVSSQQRRKNARDHHRVSAASVNRDLAALRVLFNLAVKLHLAVINPVIGVKFFPEPNRYSRVLAPEEEQRYLDAASPLLRDVATVMLETGLRPGEVCRLRVSDVDLQLRSISVRSGKTACSQRHIPLTRRALAVLQHRALQTGSEWLFPSPYDPERSVTRVNRAHEAATARANIRPGFRLYDLRHTALTRMALSGIDLPTLKELAGHSQIQMTMRYVHPTPEHKRRAMAKFEAFVSAPSSLSEASPQVR